MADCYNHLWYIIIVTCMHVSRLLLNKVRASHHAPGFLEITFVCKCMCTRMREYASKAINNQFRYVQTCTFKKSRAFDNFIVDIRLTGSCETLFPCCV